MAIDDDLPVDQRARVRAGDAGEVEGGVADANVAAAELGKGVGAKTASLDVKVAQLVRVSALIVEGQQALASLDEVVARDSSQCDHLDALIDAESRAGHLQRVGKKMRGQCLSPNGRRGVGYVSIILANAEPEVCVAERKRVIPERTWSQGLCLDVLQRHLAAKVVAQAQAGARHEIPVKQAIVAPDGQEAGVAAEDVQPSRRERARVGLVCNRLHQDIADRHA